MSTPAAARLRSLGLAATALVGGIAVVVPQHAASLVSVALGALALVAGATLLGGAAVLDARGRPETDLDMPEPAPPAPLEPSGVTEARRDLRSRAAAGEVPAPLSDRLAKGAIVRFRGQGLDLESPRTRTRDRARALVGADTWTMLEARRLPTGQHRDVPAAVAGVLDDLDRIARHEGIDP